MKVSFLLIMLLLFPLCTKGQKDTTFILRDMNSEFYHAIFIEPDKHSGFYSQIADFTFENYTSTSFLGTNDSLKEYSVQQLPQKWCPLYVYLDKFYLYAPSDWGNNSRKFITNGSVITFNMDELTQESISSFKKVSNQEYLLSLGNGRERPRLRIYIIDTVHQVAIFEETFFKYPACYKLMVAAENIQAFPIIVNYCKSMKQPEFQFDTPDFKKYLPK